MAWRMATPTASCCGIFLAVSRVWVDFLLTWCLDRNIDNVVWAKLMAFLFTAEDFASLESVVWSTPILMTLPSSSLITNDQIEKLNLSRKFIYFAQSWTGGSDALWWTCVTYFAQQRLWYLMSIAWASSGLIPVFSLTQNRSLSLNLTAFLRALPAFSVATVWRGLPFVAPTTQTKQSYFSYGTDWERLKVPHSDEQLSEDSDVSATFFSYLSLALLHIPVRTVCW